MDEKEEEEGGSTYNEGEAQVSWFRDNVRGRVTTTTLSGCGMEEKKGGERGRYPQ